ncbi:pentatricopeptide repeat-containing protein [Planoprotostelium fungivorum]|uniref:Pentatricopeptide repeat-containing protein n=1 Tax=Planoprotostelium fungivorum TaxID=1890364 RepID=A0A2P6N5G7_9EUKA|nr:pentatricopeptide repeat-containing protein [Planoprotostelium fungivorum]
MRAAGLPFLKRSAIPFRLESRVIPFHQIRCPSRAIHHDNHQVQMGVWQDMIVKYTGRENVYQVEKILSGMRQERVQMTMDAYRPVLDMYFKCRKPDELRELIQVMRKEGLTDLVIPYNMLIRLYTNKEQKDKVLQVLEEMARNNCKPNVKTMGMLVDMYSKNRDVEDQGIQSVIKSMSKVGLSVNQFFYTLLLRMFAEQENVSQFRRVWKEMKDTGCKPGIVDYTIAVEMYVRMEDTVNLSKTLSMMRRDEVHPDEIFFNIIIREFASRGNRGEVDRTLEDMKLWGSVPSSLTFTNIINEFAKSDLDSANHYANVVLDTEQEMNGELSEVMMRLFVKRDELKRAEDVLHRRIDKGHPVRPWLWHIIIGGYARAEDETSVDRLLSYGYQHGVIPLQSTYRLVMEMRTKKNRPHEVAKYIEEMREKGVKPDPLTWSIATVAYARHKDQMGCRNLMAMMQEEKVRHDTYTLGPILLMFAQMDDIKGAEEVLEMTESHEIELNGMTCRTMAAMYARGGNLKKAFQWDSRANKT